MWYTDKSAKSFAQSWVLANSMSKRAQFHTREILAFAPLAQLDRAQASDAWCRRFESAMVRQKKALAKESAFFNEINPLRDL